MKDDDWKKDMMRVEAEAKYPGITWIDDPNKNLKDKAEASGMSVEEYVEMWQSMVNKMPDGHPEKKKLLMEMFLPAESEQGEKN